MYGMKVFLFSCFLLIMVPCSAFAAERDDETALEVSIQEEQVRKMQDELDELEAEKRAAGEYTPASEIQGIDAEF